MKKRGTVDTRVDPGSPIAVLLGPGVSLSLSLRVMKAVVRGNYKALLTWNPHDAGVGRRAVIAVLASSFPAPAINQNWFDTQYSGVITFRSLEGDDETVLQLLEQALHETPQPALSLEPEFNPYADREDAFPYTGPSLPDEGGG
ncbi:MAG: hypothetical protein XU15_C0011G0151 [candidate division NC10 bacterium CSP1-5]|nr:MAG: hypothetical protein XU15_C0011G0007 [candidate division NC10 bacterium CSP1-5]KRT69469.1 MAG: hypothetical protein XU15_C0011G0151 [candidate division NC10 bacterium CSP1-5]